MKAIILFTMLYLLNFSSSNAQETDFNTVNIITGNKPNCISINTKLDTKLDNFLKIDATGSSDIVIKIINNNTEECIRCVFISGGDTYYIKNIPEGVYFVKIAYGYDWAENGKGNFCSAKFLTDAHYEVGNDLLDFHLKQSSDGYQVPSFELILRTIKNNRNNEFDSENISEEEFFK